MARAKNQEYWKERQAYLEKQLLKISDDFYKDLAKEYDKAAANIQKEIDAFYSRFAVENQITMAEARKILTADERKAFQMTLEEYIEKGRTLNYDDKWSKQLENASTVYRTSRLQALQMQMRQQVEQLYSKYSHGMEETVKNIYEDGYYHQIYEIQKGLGFGTSFTILDTKTVQNVISKPWTVDDKTFSARIWEDRTKLVNYLNQTMSQAFIRGDSALDVAKLVQSKFNTTKYNAERVSLTESAFFSAQAVHDGYKETGVRRFQFLATLDEETCPECGGLDSSEANQKGFDLKDYMPGVNANPLHPFCRCTTGPMIEPDEFDDIAERSARDKSGKYYTVPADMTFKDWRETFVGQSLTEKEQYAINTYIGPTSYRINAKLREGLTLTTDEKQLIKNLDSALDKLPVYQGEVNRSMFFDDNESMNEFLSSLIKDDSPNFPAYTSSTTGVYDENDDLRIVIRSISARDLRNYNKKESEILFRRNTVFKVTDLKYVNGKPTIYMEEMPNE